MWCMISYYHIIYDIIYTIYYTHDMIMHMISCMISYHNISVCSILSGSAAAFSTPCCSSLAAYARLPCLCHPVPALTEMLTPDPLRLTLDGCSICMCCKCDIICDVGYDIMYDIILYIIHDNMHGIIHDIIYDIINDIISPSQCINPWWSRHYSAALSTPSRHLHWPCLCSWSDYILYDSDTACRSCQAHPLVIHRWGIPLCCWALLQQYPTCPCWWCARSLSRRPVQDWPSSVHL